MGVGGKKGRGVCRKKDKIKMVGYYDLFEKKSGLKWGIEMKEVRKKEKSKQIL